MRKILIILFFSPVLAFAQKNIADSLKYASPATAKDVLWRAIVFPGFGQFYNGGKLNNIKGAVASTTELACLYFAFRRNERLKDLKKTYANSYKENPNSANTQVLAKNYEDLKYSRNTMLWLFSTLHLLSVGEAFVEAHFKNFDVQFDLKKFENNTTGVSVGVSF
ncbi:hypothetical protein IT568_03695 [bacterium]|nr:hypothetical protein [bacterium]